VERHEPAAAGPVVVTAADMVAGHVVLDVSCLDRLYLDGYVNKLQTPGGGGVLLPRSPGQADRVPGAVRADRGEVPP
jgi:hypothetical protein